MVLSVAGLAAGTIDAPEDEHFMGSVDHESMGRSGFRLGPVELSYNNRLPPAVGKFGSAVCSPGKTNGLKSKAKNSTP